MEILKVRFCKTGQELIKNIKRKIENLKIENNDSLIFIQNMRELFNIYEGECNKIGKTPLNNELKVNYLIKKLSKLSINPICMPLSFNIDFNSVEKDLKDYFYIINELNWEREKSNEDKVNRIQNGKLPYNFK